MKERQIRKPVNKYVPQDLAQRENLEEKGKALELAAKRFEISTNNKYVTH